MAALALEGLKVADFSWVVAGPLATRYLADYGATVVHVETRTSPDAARLTPPFKGGTPGENLSALFSSCNANKYGVTLNLRQAKGKEVAKRLASWADVVAESFSPGTMDSWGLGYEALRKVNPDIIMVSISLQGPLGPRATQPGYGSQTASLAGFSELTGWPDRYPAFIYGAYLDYITPRFAAAIAMAALDHRRRTGEGQHIEVSQYECCAHFLAPLLLDWEVNRRVVTRAGNQVPYAAPHGAYPCQGQDRWCVVAVFSDTEWKALIQAMGEPDWSRDQRFATLSGRKQNEDELDKCIAQWTVDHHPEAVVEVLQRVGVAAQVVHDVEGLVQDPQLQHRQHFWRQDHPEMGKHLSDSFGFLLSRTPAQLRMPAPCLGQDKGYVYTQLLGMTDNEFVDLLNQGVFE